MALTAPARTKRIDRLWTSLPSLAGAPACSLVDSGVDEVRTLSVIAVVILLAACRQPAGRAQDEGVGAAGAGATAGAASGGRPAPARTPTMISLARSSFGDHGAPAQSMAIEIDDDGRAVSWQTFGQRVGWSGARCRRASARRWSARSPSRATPARPALRPPRDAVRPSGWTEHLIARLLTAVIDDQHPPAEGLGDLVQFLPPCARISLPARWPRSSCEVKGPRSARGCGTWDPSR